jgi:hypothetical protein
MVVRTWYGMPAYAKGGEVVCFFQSGQKFRSRFATLGFRDKANLDEGAMWPTFWRSRSSPPPRRPGSRASSSER